VAAVLLFLTLSKGPAESKASSQASKQALTETCCKRTESEGTRKKGQEPSLPPSSPLRLIGRSGIGFERGSGKSEDIFAVNDDDDEDSPKRKLGGEYDAF
jgi:hypothetical protein